jgi:hypothetical protein
VAQRGKGEERESRRCLPLLFYEADLYYVYSGLRRRRMSSAPPRLSYAPPAHLRPDPSFNFHSLLSQALPDSQHLSSPAGAAGAAGGGRGGEREQAGACRQGAGCVIPDLGYYQEGDGRWVGFDLQGHFCLFTSPFPPPHPLTLPPWRYCRTHATSV